MRLVVTGSAGRGHITNDGISVCASCRCATRCRNPAGSGGPRPLLGASRPARTPLLITFRIATPGKAYQPRKGLGKWFGSKLPRLFSQSPLGRGRSRCPRVPRARYREASQTWTASEETDTARSCCATVPTLLLLLAAHTAARLLLLREDDSSRAQKLRKGYFEHYYYYYRRRLG